MSYPRNPLSPRAASTLLGVSMILLVTGLVALFAMSSGLGLALIGLGAALTAVVSADRRRQV